MPNTSKKKKTKLRGHLRLLSSFCEVIAFVKTVHRKLDGHIFQIHAVFFIITLENVFLTADRLCYYRCEMKL